MIEAARKYDRVVQAGTQARSNIATNDAIKFIQDDGIGDVYMAKGLCFKPRASIGHVKNSPIPAGVNWDAFLGPAPYRPFNANRFLYKWHWFWDTGNGDFGNQGIHQADIARWSLGKWEHPVKITAMGNYFVWDSDQETPNIQHIEFEYADGKLLQFEVRGLGTNDEGGVRIGDLIYGAKGWMNIDNEDSGESQARMAEVTLQPSGFSSYKEQPGKSFTNNDPATKDSVLNHFKNFIDCMRSRKWQDLHAEIHEGHLSTSLCHLGNIATRLGRTLHFNPGAEKFVNDPEADSYLTKMYRAPYLLPETV
jgi:predicted dehydrogenase